MVLAILVLSAVTLAAVVLIAIRVEGFHSDYRHLLRGEWELTGPGKEVRAESDRIRALCDAQYRAELLAESRTNSTKAKTDSRPQFPMTE
jgi:hypothetical protein